MHNNLPKIFYFIKDLDKDHINKLNKNIAIIYRNYSLKYDEKKILEIKKICKKNKNKFYLANNIALVNKLNLDGAYIPSFNKSLSVLRLNRNKMHLLGSAHNMREIFEKKKQRMDLIFLSPLFKVAKSKNFLDVKRFNNLTSNYNQNFIALGGLNNNNFKKLKSLNCYGFASISYISSIINKTNND